MTAPELSAEERAIVERFEAAPYPTEVTLARIKADANAWSWGGTDMTPRRP